MKTKIDKTKILFDSFEVLKDDWDNNKTDILKLFDIIFKENTSAGLEMWDYLLKENILDTISDPYLISGILLSYLLNVNFDSKQIKNLRKHSIIIDNIFSTSSFIKDDYWLYSLFLEKLIKINLIADFAYFLDIIMTNKTPQQPFQAGYYWTEWSKLRDKNLMSNTTSDGYKLHKVPEAPPSAVILFELFFLLKKKRLNINDTKLQEIQNIIYSYIENYSDKTYRAKLNAEFLNFMSSI